jgi:hypothetical protein
LAKQKNCITFVVLLLKCIFMATVVLDYDVRNEQAQKALDFMLSLGVFKKEKTGIEEAFEDIENGRVTRVFTQKNGTV